MFIWKVEFTERKRDLLSIGFLPNDNVDWSLTLYTTMLFPTGAFFIIQIWQSVYSSFYWACSKYQALFYMLNMW